LKNVTVPLTPEEKEELFGFEGRIPGFILESRARPVGPAFSYWPRAGGARA
jgi:hypothetical protein